MDNLTNYMDEKNAGAVRVPDLDWLMLTADDAKNIPTPHNVEIIQQLQDTWGNTDASSARLIDNHVRSEVRASEKIASSDIEGVVKTAKKEMMLGLNGKQLSKKLASTYPVNVLIASKDKLIKLANEQGLLGGVYVDLSPFDSCEQASKVLGRNKIRLAKYVVGDPRISKCAGHTNGYCRCLGKKVLQEVEYNTALFKDYTDHLKVAGVIGHNDSIDSVEDLREALIQANTFKEANFDVVPQVEAQKVTDVSASLGDLESALLEDANNEIGIVQKEATELRPIMAFIQNEMLKGKLGSDLKDAISRKIPEPSIKKFATHIKKAVSLQGLLGNVYVDVSYYNDVDEAVRAIKTAKTSPQYLVQTEQKDFDNTLERVAAVTGCEVLPRDGKINPKVASSYVDDLQFSSKISSDMAESARNKIDAGENVLGVLREAYMDSIGYVPPKREGGQPGRFHQNVCNKYANRDKLKTAAYRAVEAGFALEKVEQKLMQEIPTVEAVGIVRDVIASVKEVDANVLTNCTKEKYKFSADAVMKKASKCESCVRSACGSCTSQGLKFAGQEEPVLDLDPKTEKVMYDENPDVTRESINKEYDMPDYSGSNINVDIDKLRESEASDIENEYSLDGFDSSLKDL